MNNLMEKIVSGLCLAGLVGFMFTISWIFASPMLARSKNIELVQPVARTAAQRAEKLAKLPPEDRCAQYAMEATLEAAARVMKSKERGWRGGQNQRDNDIGGGFILGQMFK